MVCIKTKRKFRCCGSSHWLSFYICLTKELPFSQNSLSHYSNPVLQSFYLSTWITEDDVGKTSTAVCLNILLNWGGVEYFQEARAIINHSIYPWQFQINTFIGLDKYITKSVIYLRCWHIVPDVVFKPWLSDCGWKLHWHFKKHLFWTLIWAKHKPRFFM